MPDSRLALIRQYCDTSGVRLNNAEKDLLCMILEQPSKYDGFISEIKRDSREGRDYRDTWRSIDVGRILRTFKIKKNVEVTDNGKIII